MSGKGDTPRPVVGPVWRREWERIFGPKAPAPPPQR